MSIWRDRIIPALALSALTYANDHDPSVIIGGEDDPYLRRWWLIPRNRFFNVYLHHFCRSDSDLALHDHPWWNLSLLLTSRYAEHSIEAGGIHTRVERRAGDLKFRAAKTAHRIEIIDGPVWTIFVTGPVIREWGFHCRLGWVPWKKFVKRTERGNEIGEGCGEYE